MGNIGWTGIIIIAILVVILFGKGKISSIMGDLAKGIKSFKKGMSDDNSSVNDNSNNSSDNSDNPNSDNKLSNMPQIGWLEILAIVIIAILVLGPKEFPIALKKIGSYFGKLKNTLSSFQREVSSVTEKIDIDKDISDQKNVKKKKDIKENER